MLMKYVKKYLKETIKLITLIMIEKNETRIKNETKKMKLEKEIF